MFEPVGNNAESQRLRYDAGFVLHARINQYVGTCWHFSNPASAVLAINLYSHGILQRMMRNHIGSPFAASNQAGNWSLRDECLLDFREILVGAERFELSTPSPPDWCANQAAPRSVARNRGGSAAGRGI